MATEVELEKTYLAARLPAGLNAARSEIIIDHYIPLTANHPIIRLRRRGDRYELTKKEPVDGTDSSKQFEHTINLTAEEYAAFSTVPSKKLAKRRYYVIIEGHNAEVDVYHDDLAGLVIIDFEFDSESAMAQFVQPAVCLVDVTQESFAAAGKLAGETYEEISEILQSYNYKPLGIEP